MTANKEGYEAIPDVELGEDGAGETAELLASAKETYPSLDVPQAHVISSFDKIIAEGAPFQLVPPQVPSDSLRAERGSNFVVALIAPGIVAIGLVGVAYGLQFVGVEILNDVYPYLAAIIIFLASVRPIQSRFLASLLPVIDQVNAAEGTVRNSAIAFGTEIDSQITALQEKTREVLEPMKQGRL